MAANYKVDRSRRYMNAWVRQLVLLRRDDKTQYALLIVRKVRGVVEQESKPIQILF
jgi:hypothetical protein